MSKSNGMVDFQHIKGQTIGSNRTDPAMFVLDSNKRRYAKDSLYRSNSSLELVHIEQNCASNTLRREYGSHGSIHVIGSPTSTSESFFAMLQDCHPSSIPVDQRSPGPSEYLPLKMDSSADNSNNPLSSDCQDGIANKNAIGTSSPKLKLKIHKFWSGSSVGKPHRNQIPSDDSILGTPSSYSSINSTSTEVEEQPKRKHFAHYDCQSLTANLEYAAKHREILLGRRRNTTTGASAASMVTTRAVALNGDAEEDSGDGQNNDLLESCPFFRNEIGGEEERNMSLNWKTGSSKKVDNGNSLVNMCLHQPRVSYGLSILEYPQGQSHWKQVCHLARRTINVPRPIQLQDHGALYYRNFFYNQEHQNWFGMDDQLGPVAVSIKKEKVETIASNDSGNNTSWQYRLIVRTSELSTLRGSILEECITNIKPSNSSKLCNVKEVIEYVAPEIQLSCLRLGLSNNGAEEQLLRLDEQCISRHYKVGVMYCRAGQSTEEDMYNNQEAGPAFVEFLQMIGQTVRLNGFDKYKAGLDNKTDSTGLYSVYTVYQDYEIMFHVSTMLPYTPNNRQQLLRKRHIGNDIVTIVFQEPGAQKFTPKNIRSQFQHVFIVVGVVNPCSENTHYSIAVSRSKEVPIFGPPIIEGGLYPKGKAFTDLLLAKVINGENAAHQSTKFSTMATRTRQEYLKDLAKNYVSTSLLDTGQKFSLFSSLLKSGSNTNNSNLVGGVGPLGTCLPEEVSGALCWPVVARDEGRAGAMTKCILGLSRDTFVLIEEYSRQIVFVTPTKAILGWRGWMDGAGVRVYFHRGESLAFKGRENNARELIRALASAAPLASPAIQLQLRRNQIGQLGFHVQPDGVVTQVEANGGAARAGLVQGCRLVEICTVAVCTLSHDQMVDLLKTSAPVTVTAIPPVSGQPGTPRGICTSPDCSSASCATGGSQLPGRHRRRYDPSFSPPRSGTSSGYGTGSSSKSYRPIDNWNLEDVERCNEANVEDQKVYRLMESTYSKKSDPVLDMNASNKIILPKRLSQDLSNNNGCDMSSLVEGGEYSRVNAMRNNNASPGRMSNSNSFVNNNSNVGSENESSLRAGVGLVTKNTGSPSVVHRAGSNGSPVEAKLRVPRGQRHSAGANSSLQQELMRLINLDYVEGRSSEQGQVLQARPATVISSSSGGSPAPSSLTQAPPLPLPDDCLDWPSLVDTATRAMLQICEEQYPSLDVEGSTTGSASGDLIENIGLGEMPLPGEECCPLRRQLRECREKLDREVRSRKALEEEVKRLRQHNRRLREESVRAVQQLQRFTNWFFQTVERQQ